MKLFLKILIGVAFVVIATLCYVAFSFYQLSVDQANYIKTEAARAARWIRKKEPEETEPEPEPEPIDKTIQVQSGIEKEVVNENQISNEKIS